MRIKVRIVKCTHETRYGVDHYISPVKKNENPVDVIDAIAKECGYDEDETDEYFSSDFEEIIIDTDDFEVLAE